MLVSESFTLAAPTRVGKSTLLQVLALHRALNGDSVLYVFPTQSFVNQVVERLRSLSEGLGVTVWDGLMSTDPGVYVSTHMNLQE